MATARPFGAARRVATARPAWTRRSTASRIFCWLNVLDFDPFLGFLLLVSHVCYLFFVGLLIDCVVPVTPKSIDARR